MGVFNVVECGAIGDALTDDAAAFARAIDACATGGGGLVVVPAGRTYLCSQIVLKSNVELHIERGARILISAEAAAYEQLPGNRRRFGILAYCAQNVAITGGGTIDGNGRSVIREELPHIYRVHRRRPFTIGMVNCRHVTLQDLTIRDAAVWTVTLSGCDDVTIHNIRLYNDLKLPNNDGIDIDHCRNVRISDCHIEAGDDCICLKTHTDYGGTGPCENVTVTGCTLMSMSCALVIGCEVGEPIRNVVFSSCVIKSSHRGLGIHLSKGSDVENVIFTDMVVETRLFHEDWWGAGEPIYVTAIPWTAHDAIGAVRHVRFSNILCRSENGVFIQGWERHLIDNIVFDNVRVELDKWSKVPGGRHDIRPCPGEGVLEHPTAGFFIKNAQNITLRNCEVAWGSNRPEYFRHALECHNVPGLKVAGFKGEAAHPGVEAWYIT